MKAHILIVEDEEALTLLLRYNLEAEGYEIETVPRGDEADLLLKERAPDLVILDWMLPGLSGIELCRRLRARPETKQLPIIMLTARRGRRLQRQAVLGARTQRARARAVAPRASGAARRRAGVRRSRSGPREEPRISPAPSPRASGARVSTARGCR